MVDFAIPNEVGFSSLPSTRLPCDEQPLTCMDRQQEVDIGLVADVGSLQRLPSKVGNDSLLRELALTARDFGPEEAETLGMISKIVDGGRTEVTEAAIAIATLIACKSHRFLIFRFYSSLDSLRPTLLARLSPVDSPTTCC